MDVEPVNNSLEHIDGGNEATTITNYHDQMFDQPRTNGML